mgnify:CR=1 FL=1
MTMTRELAIEMLSTRDFCGMLCGYTSGYTEALDMAVEALQIEIVRCKDCKHRETEDCPMYWTEWIMFEDCDGYTDNNSIIHDYTTDDGYCHYGERKE